MPPARDLDQEFFDALVSACRCYAEYGCSPPSQLTPKRRKAIHARMEQFSTFGPELGAVVVHGYARRTQDPYFAKRFSESCFGFDQLMGETNATKNVEAYLTATNSRGEEPPYAPRTKAGDRSDFESNVTEMAELIERSRRGVANA